MGGGGTPSGGATTTSGGGWLPWAQALSTLGGLGISARGGALGPVLLGLGGMMEGSRERSAMRSLAEQFAGEFPDSPGLAKTAFSLAEQRQLGPSEIERLRDRAEEHQRHGTLAGGFEERAKGLRQGEEISPESLTGTNVGAFPVRMPAKAPALERAGDFETLAQIIRAGMPPPTSLIERATAAPKPETFTSGRYIMERQPGEGRFSVIGQAPEEPRTYVSGERVITTAPGQPSRVEEVLTPEDRRTRERFTEYRGKVAELMAREERGQPVPIEVLRRLVTSYGDVVPKDDPIRQRVAEYEREQYRAQFRRGAPPTTTTTVKTRAIKLDDVTRPQFDNAVDAVANDLTQRGLLKEDGRAFVVNREGQRIPKTVVIEQAFEQTNPGMRVRVAWDPKMKKFRVLHVEEVTGQKVQRGPARESRQSEDEEEE